MQITIDNRRQFRNKYIVRKGRKRGYHTDLGGRTVRNARDLAKQSKQSKAEQQLSKKRKSLSRYGKQNCLSQ